MYNFDIIMHISFKGIYMRRRKNIIILMILSLFLTACIGNMGPKERIEEFLNGYIQNDANIIEELNTYLEKQDLTNEQTERYKKIIKEEYSTLKYEIKKETIDNDTALVETEITVKDLYGASKKAEKDLLDNPMDFYIDGNYSKELFINHKLDIMESSNELATYTINFELEKKDGKWKLKKLDDETLEKIHGIYNYEQT